MINEVELKRRLIAIQQGEDRWSKANVEKYIPLMMAYIGTTDSELRDELIYRSFSQLITKDRLSQEELLVLLDQCLSVDFLFKGIGDKECDSVFTRAFTTLVIALIMYKDNQMNFISQEKYMNVTDSLIRYMEQEDDLRGYVPKKGWAHSIAHASDALDEVVKSNKCNQKVMSRVMDVLWGKVFVSQSVYIHDEEERIIIPIISMIENDFPISNVEMLIEQIPYKLEQKKKLVKQENYWFLAANCKSFLKSFYIAIEEHPHNLETVQGKIKKSLESLF